MNSTLPSDQKPAAVFAIMWHQTPPVPVLDCLVDIELEYRTRGVFWKQYQLTSGKALMVTRETGLKPGEIYRREWDGSEVVPEAELPPMMPDFTTAPKCPTHGDRDQVVRYGVCIPSPEDGGPPIVAIYCGGCLVADGAVIWLRIP